MSGSVIAFQLKQLPHVTQVEPRSPILLSCVYDDLFVSEGEGVNIVYILELLGCFSSYLVSSVVAWGLRALHARMFSGLFSRFLSLRLVSCCGLAYLSASWMLCTFRVLVFTGV